MPKISPESRFEMGFLCLETKGETQDLGWRGSQPKHVSNPVQTLGWRGSQPKHVSNPVQTLFNPILILFYKNFFVNPLLFVAFTVLYVLYL